MTKEITKAIILQEMQDKLQLREFDPAKFLFDETVVPVYEIEQHLKASTQNFVTKSVTAISAPYFFTVPQTEKWRLSRYDVVFMTGAYTVAGVYLQRRIKKQPNAYLYLDLKAAQSASYHTELPTPVMLYPGDTLHINVDGYTSTGDLRLYLDYEMEEMR